MAMHFLLNEYIQGHLGIEDLLTYLPQGTLGDLLGITFSHLVGPRGFPGMGPNCDHFEKQRQYAGVSQE